MALALLSGEHPTLPWAELDALAAVAGAKAQRVTDRIARVPSTVASRAAGVHAWGEEVASAPDDEDGVAALGATLANDEGGTSVAVTIDRVGGARGGVTDVERRLGAALVDAGNTVDLTAPDRTLMIWRHDGLHAVWLTGRNDRGRFEARTVERREHFMPVSLHPRRAAMLVHLAQVPPGSRIYDPFCGTGAILLEAAAEGHQAIGSDIDAWMVQGTYQTLTDAPPEPLDAEVFVADIGDAPALVDEVDAIVSDLPFGRAATTAGEPIASLYDRALQTFHDVLPAGGRAVLGLCEPEALRPGEFGFTVQEHHVERVHKSLTRHFIVIQK